MVSGPKVWLEDENVGFLWHVCIMLTILKRALEPPQQCPLWVLTPPMNKKVAPWSQVLSQALGSRSQLKAFSPSAVCGLWMAKGSQEDCTLKNSGWTMPRNTNQRKYFKKINKATESNIQSRKAEQKSIWGLRSEHYEVIHVMGQPKSRTAGQLYKRWGGYSHQGLPNLRCSQIPLCWLIVRSPLQLELSSELCRKRAPSRAGCTERARGQFLPNE